MTDEASNPPPNPSADLGPLPEAVRERRDVSEERRPFAKGDRVRLTPYAIEQNLLSQTRARTGSNEIVGTVTSYPVRGDWRMVRVKPDGASIITYHIDFWQRRDPAAG